MTRIVKDPLSVRKASFTVGCNWTIKKYDGDFPSGLYVAERGIKPYEISWGEGNLLLYGGASLIWECLKGNGTATAAQNLTYLNNTQSALGVGDDASTEAGTQTGLLAATNHKRKGMDGGFPTHADPGAGAPASSNAKIQFQSTFGTADANWTWNEWIIANDVAEGAHRALNRKKFTGGVKVVGATWVFQVELTAA